MIGKITGRVDMIGDDHVLIDTGGLGYVVFVSERTRASLPPAGEAVSLFTELVVREDLLQLYGFFSVAEREMHRLLQSVQGVGAKAALAIQGTLGPDGVGRAIALGDAAAIKAAPGVGPKLAARVVNELKDKAAGVMTIGAGAATNAGAVIDAGPAPLGAEADALSALLNLGYGQGEAAAAVAAVAREGETETDALIRAALKRLAPGG